MARIEQTDWLETFVAVADHGSFSEAASVVHRSQSRVSAHVASLERALGAPLIDRRHRPVELTDAGDVFLPYAREVLLVLDKAATAVDSLSGVSRGRVVVGAHPSVSAAFLPAVLREFALDHPQVRVELTEDTSIGLTEALESGIVHLAIRSETAGNIPPGLRSSPLWRESYVAVVPQTHPLATSPTPLRPVDLSQQSLIVIAEPGSKVDPDTAMALERWGLVPEVAWQTEQPQTLANLVKSGLGVGLINRLAMEVSETSGLALLPVGDVEHGRLVSLWWDPERYMSSAARALSRAIMDAPRPAHTHPAALD